MTSSGIEPATFRFVAQHLNRSCHITHSQMLSNYHAEFLLPPSPDSLYLASSFAMRAPGLVCVAGDRERQNGVATAEQNGVTSVS